MEKYMKISGGYNDLNEWIIIHKGVNVMIKNVKTHKRKIMKTNDFLSNYIEIKK